MLEFLKKDRNKDLMSEIRGLALGAKSIEKNCAELGAILGSIMDGKTERTEQIHERILALIRNIERTLHQDEKISGMAEHSEEKSKITEPEAKL